jgi:hypothetical protein
MSATVAPWWANTNSGDDTWTVHSPDTSRYHSPSVDPGLTQRIGDSRGAIIPHNFEVPIDVNQPTPVIVDGQTVVDYGRLRSSQILQAHQNARTQAGNSGVIGGGSAGSRRLTAMAVMSLGKPLNQAIPSDIAPEYLLTAEMAQARRQANPPRGTTSAVEIMPAAIEPSLVQPVPTPKLAPTYAGYTDSPSAAAPLPAAAAPLPASAPGTVMKNQISEDELANVVLRAMERLGRVSAATPTSLPGLPAAASTSPAFDFATIGLPFLSASPGKPTKTVFFDLGPLGAMKSRYHEVVVSAELVALVYDRRYEDGDQWAPPKCASLTVRLGTNKDIVVLSPDWRISIGCLDIILLPIAPPPEMAPTEQTIE